MEVDFFKGALQKVEARRQKKDRTGGSEQLSIKLQELAGISGAGIGDDKADVEIVSGGGELPDEILPGDIKHDDSMLHTVTLAKFNAYFLKQVLPPRHEDNIDSEAAICCANSLPIPDEAPVTSAQGPNLFLSSATVIFSLRSACLGLVVCVVSYIIRSN